MSRQHTEAFDEIADASLHLLGCNSRYLSPVMKYRDLVSVSNVSGLVSVLEVLGLETSNIAKKWFIKISIIQRFFCCICRWETTKTRRKNARNL